MQQLMETLPRLNDIAARCGMDSDDVQRALGRLWQAGGTFAEATGAEGGVTTELLVDGLTRNVEQDPMLVGWALRVASRLGETAWQRFFDNFVVRMVAERPMVVKKLRDELGMMPPMTLVVNPTMACNLRCTGCYAYEFSRAESMDPDLFRRIVREARDMGIRMLTVTGGEPYAYKPLVNLISEFPDMMFLTYTNGTLIDDRMADRIAAAGNIMPALSVEGYEAETDARRGEGVHKDVLAAMARLKERGVLFGISVTPTSKNIDTLTSDAFMDFYMERGISFAWMFTYIPVGKSPDLSLMPTPEQRDQLRQATVRWRRTRPLFLGDFWNDGAQCAGCMSASRYAFIASDGKVQPCTFVHFYTHNIKEHSLKEIFASPFFASIRDAQPYDRNMLRPCKIIDHPHVLRQLVDECGARPAYAGADDIVKDPRVSGFLDQYSERYAELADTAWKGPDYEDGRRVLVPFSGLVDLYVRHPERMANAERNTPVTEQRKRAPAA